MIAVSPALMVGVTAFAVTEKSTTFTGGCAIVPLTAPPFALTLPDTLMVELRTGIDGVRSTSTAAGEHGGGVVLHTARFGMLHEIVDPVTAPQVPVPVVIFAVADDASPLIGKFRALKTTRFAGSGPWLVISKVNATWV